MTRSLIGHKNGTLTGVRPTGARSGNSVIWECLCDCGAIHKMAARELVHAKSPRHPGCKLTKITLHPLYGIWSGIKHRCTYHKDYAGRGITISEDWKNKFENFARDMGPRPSLKHSIDRVNNDGNYCKENCVWATAGEQANNPRTRKLTLPDCLDIFKSSDKKEYLATKYDVSVKTIQNIKCHQYSLQVKGYVKGQLLLERSPPTQLPTSAL